MTNEDIIRMAKDAGGTGFVYDTYPKIFGPMVMLKRFAELVEAATIAKLPGRGDYHEGYEAGAAAEREECAKVCERSGAFKDGYNCAAAIRARGQA